MSGRWGPRVLLPSLVCLLLLAAWWAPGVLGADNPNWQTGIEAALPAGAASGNPGVAITSMSCPSAGNCVAVGHYLDSSANTQGLLLTESSGAWSTGVEAMLPAGTAPNPSATLYSVSCSSPGNCTAVGDYVDSSLHGQGLLLTETSGTWAMGVEAVPPSGVATDPAMHLDSVSCSSADSCTAVGDYVDSSGHGQGIVLSEITGIWSQGFKVTVPAGAATNPSVALSAVSCASVGNCSAVGDYSDASSAQQGLLVTETGETLGPAVEATLPADAGTNPAVALNSVSCTAPGACAAVGRYTDASGHNQGVLLSQASGTWGTGVEATLPTNAGTNPSVVLDSVSCPATGNCTAVGGYHAGSGLNSEGLLLDESSGTWGTGLEAALPANEATTQFADVSTVSCGSAGNCVAGGGYYDGSSLQQGLLLAENSGTWATGVEATLPANAGSSPGVSRVACPSQGSCTAVGTYTDGSGNTQGLLLGAVPANPTLSLTAPAADSAGAAIAPSSVAAVLSAGSSPAGTITVTVFGPQATPPAPCASGGTTVGTASVSGNGTYNPTTGFTPPTPGDYWWYASYGGDLGDNPAASACGTSMAETIVPDTGGPSISIAAPVSGATYTQRQLVDASYTCTDPDGVSDVASCAGPVASGSPLDTSTTGSHSFTVRASDRGGSVATDTVSYTVTPPGGQIGTSTPTITTSGKPSTKLHRGTVLVAPGIEVSCPAGGQACTATETATALVRASTARAKTKKIVIGRAQFTIPAGKTVRLTFMLNPQGARLLRKHGHLRVQVTVFSRVDHGTPATGAKTITIKNPARRR